VAAPAFAAIAAEALRQLGISPARPREVAAARASPPARPASARTRPMPAPGQAVVPDLIGLSASSAAQRLRDSALEAELRGSGRTVAQSPPAGVFVQRGARVLVTLAQVQ
jgi:hypothetical protein